MTKDELKAQAIAKLKEAIRDGDTENFHLEAAHLLIEFLDDKKVSRLWDQLD